MDDDQHLYLKNSTAKTEDSRETYILNAMCLLKEAILAFVDFKTYLLCFFLSVQLHHKVLVKLFTYFNKISKLLNNHEKSYLSV